jgi:hypothetical protein
MTRHEPRSLRNIEGAEESGMPTGGDVEGSSRGVLQGTTNEFTGQY